MRTEGFKKSVFCGVCFSHLIAFSLDIQFGLLSFSLGTSSIGGFPKCESQVVKASLELTVKGCETVQGFAERVAAAELIPFQAVAIWDTLYHA